jgi:hypothetical protein
VGSNALPSQWETRECSESMTVPALRVEIGGARLPAFDPVGLSTRNYFRTSKVGWSSILLAGEMQQVEDYSASNSQASNPWSNN